MNWEIEPMRSAGEDSPLSVRDVLDRQRRDVVPAQTGIAPGSFRFLLPLAQPPEQTVAASEVARGSRPEYYDFDLFSWSEGSHTLDDRLLLGARLTPSSIPRRPASNRRMATRSSRSVRRASSTAAC